MKNSQYLRKAVTFSAMIFVCLGLFGCSKKQAYTTAEMSALSTSCGQMDLSHSYSFTIKKEGETMLFSANCFVDGYEVEVDDQPITAEEAEEFRRIAEEENLIEKIRKYRRPLLSNLFHISDEVMNSTCIRFADGGKYDAETNVGNAMTGFFYRLAEKYGK